MFTVLIFCATILAALINGYAAGDSVNNKCVSICAVCCIDFSF